MTPRQRRIVIALTVAILAVVALWFTAGCSSKAVIPPDVVRPSWTPRPQQHESVPLYTSCQHARLAGADLPLTPQSPGWNPRLDRNHDGEAC